MPIAKVEYKDREGLVYKHPERSCDRCLKYPCIDNMNVLRCNFAKYGCKNWSDSNFFE